MADFADHWLEFTICVALFGFITVLGFAAARWRRPNSMHALEEWGLGGRAFGSVVTFFLLGGDVYTAYTFVAVPALVYGTGAMGFFAVAFAVITIPLVFLILPRMWSVAHVHGFVTPAEFVRARFGSPTLSVLVAVTAIAATMPYIALQLIGVEVIFKAMGVNGAWSATVAFGLLALFTFNSGLRAPALISIVKDLLIFVTVLSVLTALALSDQTWSRVFHVSAERFALTPKGGGLLLTHTNQLGYATLVLGSAMALFLYPHALTGVLAARNRVTIKRSLALMPIYTLMLGIIALLGFAAISLGIKPIGANPAAGRTGDINTIVPQVFHSVLPGWGAGIAYAAIGIGALVPAAIMSIAAANLFTRSIYREFIRPDATAAQEMQVSRMTSLLVKLGALAVILLLSPRFSVDLQLIGGVVILQVLPAVAIGLYSAWFHRHALVAGLVSGLVTGIAILYSIPRIAPDGTTVVQQHFGGASWPLAHLGLGTGLTVYAGLVALAVNLAVTVVGTWVLHGLRVAHGEDRTRSGDYVADEGDPTVNRMGELVDGLPRYEGRHITPSR
jgi:solute:Na+ symporter, SSS family